MKTQIIFLLRRQVWSLQEWMGNQFTGDWHEIAFADEPGKLRDRSYLAAWGAN